MRVRRLFWVLVNFDPSSMSQAQDGGRRSELVTADRLRVNERSRLLQRMTETSDSEPNVRQVAAHTHVPVCFPVA